jgi:branched-chain amino acid transport system ATP-binding protein
VHDARRDATGPVPLLDVRSLRAGYGQGDVLHGIDLAVGEGDLVALLGPNGAGKSTTLRAIAGFVAPSAGSVWLAGLRADGHGPAELSRCGLFLLQDRRSVFPNLTVADNLRLATAAPERRWRSARDETLDLFPKLRDRLGQVARTMSGGEQQMLALARAFAARPRLLLLDEPSLGLAPQIVDQVFAAIRRFREEGITVLLVEQYVQRALEVADHVAVLQKGTVVWRGEALDTDVDALADRYLGTPA